MNVIKVICICFMTALISRAEAQITELDLYPFSQLNEEDAIAKFDSTYKDVSILSVKGVDQFFSDHKYAFIKNLVTKHHISPKGFLEFINVSYVSGFVCGNDIKYHKDKSSTCKQSITYAPNKFTAAKLEIAQFLKNAGDAPGDEAFYGCVGRNELDLLKLFVVMNGGKLPDKELAESMVVVASGYGNISMVTYLIDMGVSPNAKTSDSFYAIYSAVSYPDIFFYLIEKGADYQVVGYRSTTPILHAAREGCLEVVQFFVDKKVDPNALHGDLSAITMAKKYNLRNGSAVIALLKKIK